MASQLLREETILSGKLNLQIRLNMQLGSIVKKSPRDQ